MDIAAYGAMSIDMHMAQTQQAVDIAMVQKAMDLQETQGAAIVQSIQQSSVSFGHMLDIRA